MRCSYLRDTLTVNKRLGFGVVHSVPGYITFGLDFEAAEFTI